MLGFRLLSSLSLATDLNRRPADYKSAALPTELARRVPEEGLDTYTQAISANTAPFYITARLIVVHTIYSATLAYVRKVEDGCVDIYFYDWLY